MPELPEVETVKNGMEQALKGRVVTSVEARRAGLRIPFPPDLKSSLEGRRIEDLGRRAKYILVTLEGGPVLVLHLGMSGRVALLPPEDKREPEKHDHLVFGFDNDARMMFADPRRFGMVFTVPQNELDDHKAFKNLGPEPLGNHFSGPVLVAALKGRKSTIKAALLDQRIIAGLGNIYVCEALYDAGISPLRLAGGVQEAEAEKLTVAIKDVLKRAIKAGGSTLRDYRHADGELGYFQHEFKTYGRVGESCPDCDCNVDKTGGIKRIVQSGRSSFYCPQKQK